MPRRRTEELKEGQFWAVRDVSFEVRPGEAMGIIGANGAGKSTSLKVLTRILRPTTGKAVAIGRVGALIEVASGFHPDLTGRENVYLQGAIMGMKRVEIARQFDAIVDFAGLPEYMDTPVKRYSSGMNARLGFAIAAHLNPQLLVIDEVLSVGDMAFQQKCFDRMLEFKKQGVAIVLVSHNLQAVLTLCDSSTYLDHKVVAQGRSAAVIDAYLKNLGSQEAARINEHVEVKSCELLSDKMEPVVSANPGDQLRLRVDLRAMRDLEEYSFFFRVRRSTDHLLVYDGNIPAEEANCGRLRGGETVTLDFVFSANLTRGHYYVELHLFHSSTQIYLIQVSPAATFTIDEMRTHAGIADLQVAAFSNRQTTVRQFHSNAR